MGGVPLSVLPRGSSSRPTNLIESSGPPGPPPVRMKKTSWPGGGSGASDCASAAGHAIASASSSAPNPITFKIRQSLFLARAPLRNEPDRLRRSVRADDQVGAHRFFAFHGRYRQPKGGKRRARHLHTHNRTLIERRRII